MVRVSATDRFANVADLPELTFACIAQFDAECADGIVISNRTQVLARLNRKLSESLLTAGRSEDALWYAVCNGQKVGTMVHKGSQSYEDCMLTCAVVSMHSGRLQLKFL